jgi:hypothetical protein
MLWKTDTLEQNRTLQLFNVRHQNINMKAIFFVVDITTVNSHNIQRPMTKIVKLSL